MNRTLLSTILILLSPASLVFAALTFPETTATPDSSGAQNQNAIVKNLALPDAQGRKLEGPIAKAYEAYTENRFDEAIKIAKPLADQGNMDALYLMGIAHETGRGAEASREKALDFYQRAAKLSHNDAPLRISMILLSSDKYAEREDARKLLEETAKKDAKVAGRILGEAWLRGGLLSDKPDPKQAVTWWEKSATAGDISSMRVLASLYDGQLGLPELVDHKKAVKYYSDAAALGDAGAMVILGSRLLNGEEAIREEVRGLEWLKKAIDAGETSAHLVIGDFQERIKKSDKEALAAYQRGADAGQPDCMVRLANFYLNGREVKKDAAKAKEILKEAAAKGNLEAQYQFAMMLLSDEKPELGVAYLNLLSAANGNILNAQNELGLLYLSGRMGLADPTAAVTWLTRAAKAGNAAAQNNLGALYESGSSGLERNMQNAGELYTLAANQGHPDASLALIRLSVETSNDPQNLPRAWAQASLIAEQGHKGAAEMVKQLEALLDKTQLKQAQDLLKEYKTPQPVKPGK